jgi:cyclohexa-1,5-dienecarbonyl-CoA hydratase
MKFQKIRLEYTHQERVARITLAAPKANIVDRAMIRELDAAFSQVGSRELNAIVLTADGPHFSFGASVQEHLPDQIAGTLQALHALLRRIYEAPAPVIAAVRGQCLGGGFELVLACDLILADKTAQFASPEIKLAVFAPAASALLPVRVGEAVASRLLLTGAALTAEEASRCGLVAKAVDDLDGAVNEWLESDFLPRSPTNVAKIRLPSSSAALAPRLRGRLGTAGAAIFTRVDGHAGRRGGNPRLPREAFAAVEQAGHAGAEMK